MMHKSHEIAQYDVLIIGAGWAGLTLARQLKLAHPDISILQLESSTQFSAKIGEATVEMTGHYFIHRLGLVNYLYRNHLPKNGLRFLFDSEQHDLSLDQMTEHGTTSIPPHPAFQLDRARLEEDLVQMNIEQGIELLTGAKVKSFNIDGDNLHQLHYEYKEERHQAKGRWLIDASGKASLIARKQKLHHRRDVPKNCAAWARFSNVKDIDSLGSAQWRRKVNGRFLSTIHFTGAGYWIWVIPLSGGFTSIGVDCDKSVMDSPPLKQQDFINFLAQHKGLSELLTDAKLEDFEAWGQLAYRSERYISEHRWATTGFAAMFLDPLFSGGGDMIALLNDTISNTIFQDLHTDSIIQADKQLARTVPVANQQAHEFYQGLYAYIGNVNPILDCAELCSPVLAYNTAIYFLDSAWDYMSGHFADFNAWQKKDYIRRGYLTLEKILNQQILSASHRLKQQNRYFDHNCQGAFESGADLYKYFVFEMGQKGKDGWRIDLHIKLWVDIFLKITASKLNLSDFSERKLVQENLNFPQILATPLFDEMHLPELLATLSQALTKEVQLITEHTVLVEVCKASFDTNEVIVQLIDTDDEEQIKTLTKQANMIWSAKQEYIAMPSMVPVFLQYCRKIDTDVMTQPVLATEVV